VLQGDRLAGAGGPAEGRHLHPVLNTEAGPGQPQRLAHNLKYSGEHVPTGSTTRSVPEPLTESGHRPHRVVPLAVQPPVDPALQAVPGRREPDRNHRGRQQAAAQPNPLAQQPLGQLDYPDVHTDPTGG
jgi:hypothetical protein